MSSTKQDSDDTEDDNAIPLQDLPEPPPSYETVIASQLEESSVRLLQGEGDGATGGAAKDDDTLAAEEKKRQHDQKLKKLVADLRRECSVEVAPEEIEMLDVGGEDILPESDISSLQSSLNRSKNDQKPDVQESEPAEVADNEDATDASVMRWSRRLSRAESHVTTSEPNFDNDVEHPRDETSVEDGTDRLKKTGLVAQVLASPTKMLIIAGSILFCLGLLLLIILLPKSFVYVEYYEYALSRNTVTGVIDYNNVYDSGCHLLRPQDELVRFQATAHFIDQDLVIMDSSKLSIKLAITLQYFLKHDEIPQLYKKYHYGYDSIINSLVESKVKNVAVNFSLEQFLLHRPEVEATIEKHIQYTLSGDCCEDCCPDKCGKNASQCRPPACRPKGSCYQGHHVTVKYFQLGTIVIPSEVYDRNLKQVLLGVEVETEKYKQQKAIEVKKTEQMVQSILNEAEELRQDARARERVIQANAEADKNAVLEKARVEALKEVFSHFNFTDEEDKLSYIYARALAEKGDDIHYTSAYSSLTSASP
ncbi:peptidase [Plakobranchus ocellatus]|uniref:Peptidase n=1 Tax=Plakobranchus ocellatus TaxID=259542 RepID=A0AAV3ZZM1_9GAST|nr:peptidase [Plakobranchus ocellatus]